MNVSATLSAFKLLVKPGLCIPHATVPTFDSIPLPISRILAAANGGQEPDIRAIVLDKDNCFAKPKENAIYKPYSVCECHDTVKVPTIPPIFRGVNPTESCF